MTVYYRNLNRHETYTTTKKNAKNYFSSLPNLNISFGLSRHFEWDERCPKPTKINGTVVSAVWFDRDRSASISFFPINRDLYPESAYQEFNQNVLANIRDWIDEQFKKTDTAIVGIEQLIVEWETNKHLLHYKKFL